MSAAGLSVQALEPHPDSTIAVTQDHHRPEGQNRHNSHKQNQGSRSHEGHNSDGPLNGF